MSLGISGAGSSSQLARLLQSMQAAQSSQAGGFKPSSITDSLSSDSISSDTGASGGTDVGQTLSSSTLKAAAATDTSTPFQQLSTDIQNLLLELQSFAGQTPSSNAAIDTSKQPGSVLSGLIGDTQSKAQEAEGRLGQPIHGDDGDGDDAKLASPTSSTGTNSLDSNPLKTDFSQLLTDLQKAIQSFSAPSSAPAMTANTQPMSAATSVAA
jgi:hypothetical protein